MHFGLLFSLIFQLFAQWRHSVLPAPFGSFPSRGGRGRGAWSQVLLFQFHTQTLQPVVAHCVKLGSIQRNNELYQLKVDVGMLNTVKIYWADISRIPHMFLLTYNGVKSLSLLAGCDLPLHISYVFFFNTALFRLSRPDSELFRTMETICNRLFSLGWAAEVTAITWN